MQSVKSIKIYTVPTVKETLFYAPLCHQTANTVHGCFQSYLALWTTLVPTNDWESIRVVPVHVITRDELTVRSELLPIWPPIQGELSIIYKHDISTTSIYDSFLLLLHRKEAVLALAESLDIADVMGISLPCKQRDRDSINITSP